MAMETPSLVGSLPDCLEQDHIGLILFHWGGPGPQTRGSAAYDRSPNGPVAVRKEICGHTSSQSALKQNAGSKLPLVVFSIGSRVHQYADDATRGRLRYPWGAEKRLPRLNTSEDEHTSLPINKSEWCRIPSNESHF